jgi:hypothetical protein
MWQKRKINKLLAPLAGVIDGETADGQLTGAYRGYNVEARPHSGYPIKYTSPAASGGVAPESVNMLRVVLAGVAGSQWWHCQSAASSYLHDLTSRFTAGGLLSRFTPGEFKFEGVDTLNDAFERMGERLVKRLGMPIEANADPALQERLIAAGLFSELDELRLGGHPYLPKVQFSPGGRELTELYLKSQVFSGAEAAVDARLRAAGMPDYRSLMKAKMEELEAETPGRLELDVEAGKAQVPDDEKFRAVLEHAVRIAEINAKVNQRAELR